MSKRKRKPRTQPAGAAPSTPPPTPPCRPSLSAPGRFAAVFIAVYLLIQLLLPLRYYLNTPTPDERFAWRMFSYQSRRECSASVWRDVVRDGRTQTTRLDDGDLSLNRWRGMLENERPAVIEKFLHHSMELSGVVGARIVLRCTDLDHDTPYTITYSIDAEAGIERSTDSAS